MFKIELGVKVKDKITGLEGIVVTRLEHLFGCNTYAVCPKVSETGSKPETEWLDEGRLEVIGEGISAKEVTSNRPGCEGREHP